MHECVDVVEGGKLAADAAAEGSDEAASEAASEAAAAALLPLLSGLCSRLGATATQMAIAEASGHGLVLAEGGDEPAVGVRVLVGGWNHLHAHALRRCASRRHSPAAAAPVR